MTSEQSVPLAMWEDRVGPVPHLPADAPAAPACSAKASRIAERSASELQQTEPGDGERWNCMIPFGLSSPGAPPNLWPPPARCPSPKLELIGPIAPDPLELAEYLHRLMAQLGVLA